jgi:hypothetical protein
MPGTWLGKRGISAMDYKSLTSLVLRLTGAVIIISAVTSTPQTFATLINLEYAAGVDKTGVNIWLLTVVASGLPILVGLLLIYFPASVANGIISGGAEAADVRLLQQVAFSVLGLYFITVAAYDAVFWIAKLKIYSAIWDELDTYGQPFRPLRPDFAGLVATGAQFVAGIILLLSGRGLAHFVHRLRSP